MFEEYPDILSVSDVEKALGIGRNKAYYLINHNYIKHIKIKILKKNCLLIQSKLTKTLKKIYI